MSRHTFRSWVRVASALAAAACILPGFAFAQEPQVAPSIDAQTHIEPAITEAHRLATMAANIVLTDEEAVAFWPIYREYRREVAKINGKLAALIIDYAQNFADVTDAKASTYTKEFLDMQQSRLTLMRKYVDKYGKILSPAQTARVIQIETKLDALVDAGRAKSIPLIQP